MTSLMLSNTTFDESGLGTQAFSPAGLLCHIYLFQPGAVYGGWGMHSRTANFIRHHFHFENAKCLDTPPVKVCEWFGFDPDWVDKLESGWAELHCNYDLASARAALIEGIIRPELKRLAK